MPTSAIYNKIPYDSRIPYAERSLRGGGLPVSGRETFRIRRDITKATRQLELIPDLLQGQDGRVDAFPQLVNGNVVAQSATSTTADDRVREIGNALGDVGTGKVRLREQSAAIHERPAPTNGSRTSSQQSVDPVRSAGRNASYRLSVGASGK